MGRATNASYHEINTTPHNLLHAKMFQSTMLLFNGANILASVTQDFNFKSLKDSKESLCTFGILAMQISAEANDCREFTQKFGQPWNGPFIQCCCEEIQNGTFELGERV